MPLTLLPSATVLNSKTWPNGSAGAADPSISANWPVIAEASIKFQLLPSVGVAVPPNSSRSLPPTCARFVDFSAECVALVIWAVKVFSAWSSIERAVKLTFGPITRTFRPQIAAKPTFTVVTPGVVPPSVSVLPAFAGVDKIAWPQKDCRRVAP